jgi:hypothetical protein
MLIHTTSYFVSILVSNALWVAAYLDVAGRWASHCIEQNREAARQWLTTQSLCARQQDSTPVGSNLVVKQIHFNCWRYLSDDPKNESMENICRGSDWYTHTRLYISVHSNCSTPLNTWPWISTTTKFVPRCPHYLVTYHFHCDATSQHWSYLLIESDNSKIHVPRFKLLHN